MADFESPIVIRYRAGGPDGLALSDESALHKIVVRADDGTAAADGLAVGYGSSRSDGDVTIIGQRPTEWLLVGPAAAVDAYAEGIDTTGHVSLIDHTHARALFRLTGVASSRVLEKVCSLDWSEAMTPNGSAMSASVAKTNCDISRDDVGSESSYRIACDRSFGQYLFDALLDAGSEFGITPTI